MKAIDGMLPIDQRYKLDGIDYCEMAVNVCENCGHILSNVASVIGSNDNKTYRIGLDCAATLTGITPSEIEQAKKQFRLKAKIRKEIKKGYVKTIALITNGENKGMALVFRSLLNSEADFENMRRRWMYSIKFDKYKEVIESSGIKVIEVVY